MADDCEEDVESGDVPLVIDSRLIGVTGDMSGSAFISEISSRSESSNKKSMYSYRCFLKSNSRLRKEGIAAREGPATNMYFILGEDEQG
jgi:hypothetical protein